MTGGVTGGAVPIDVVAAVIRDDQGRMLIGRRPAEKRHGGLWEFPGGKVDPGESHRDAMARELAEELSLALVSMAERPVFGRVDEGGAFRILFYDVEVRGVPVAHEHSELFCGLADQLAPMPLAPSDAAFVAWL